MAYPTPTAAQTSANSTAWSLKKSNSFPFPRYKRGAEGLGAAGFPITNLRQPNGSDGRSAQCGRAHVLRLRADLGDRREEQLAQAPVRGTSRTRSRRRCRSQLSATAFA